ncbi:MAG: hypothetical protein JSW62_04250 [Thermoplasmatales archaeon]|nr:MAG: hypothetical protein JSW62_04250 [Thermoplasmatales archaeon]
MGIVDIVIKASAVSAIIIGVLGALFVFGFIDHALGDAFPYIDFSGQPFLTVGWIMVIVAIVIILLIVVATKVMKD